MMWPKLLPLPPGLAALAIERQRLDAERLLYPEAAHIAKVTAISFEEAKRLWLALGTEEARAVAGHCSRNAISPNAVLSLIKNSRGRKKEGNPT